MRIVKLAELLQQERGTLFSPCTKLDFSDLCVFLGPDGTSGKDFVYDSLMGPRNWDGDDLDNILKAFEDSSIEMPMDLHYTGRWGRHDEEATFLIYTLEDQVTLLSRLQLSIGNRLGGLEDSAPEKLITVVTTDQAFNEHSTKVIGELFDDAIVIGCTRPD